MQTDMHRIGEEGRLWKEQKYLLINHSFPHYPQVFPQGLSTAGRGCGYTAGIYIKLRRAEEGFIHFLCRGYFHNSKIFVKNFGLDRQRKSWAERKNYAKNFQIGVDFGDKERYNV